MAFDLVGIGGANLDLCHQSFSPHVPRDSNPGVFKLSVGGVMRNICENAARMGVSTSLVSAVGNDLTGSVIIQSCLDAGIDIDGLIRKEFGSSMYVSLLDDKGDMALACSDMRITAQITGEELLLRKPLFSQAKVVCIDGNMTEEAIVYAASLCNNLGVPVFFDPVSTSHAKKFKQHLALFHTAKPNLLELEMLTHSKITDEQSFHKAVELLFSAGLQRVFVTFGERGACCATRDGRFYYKTPRPCSMVNATGAGDAFTAALLYCHINKMPEEETLSFAMAAGEVAVSSEETVNPGMSLELIKQHLKGDLL